MVLGIPLIINDGYIVIMEINKINHWSCHAGILEPKNDEMPSLENVVEYSGIKESVEEVLDDNLLPNFNSRIPFMSNPKCTHKLFCSEKNSSKLSHIEFMTPSQLDGSQKKL